MSFCTWEMRVTVMAIIVVATTACREAEPQIPVPITGLDHLAEHLSIQQFSVNGQGGAQAGKGGSQICCVAVPVKWRPDLTVKVAWGVTNWPAKVYSWHEREIHVERYDEVGNLNVHFLRDGSVRVLVSAIYPERASYPGPSYSTVPRKEPWELYHQKPGEPEYTRVKNAMEAPAR